MAVRVEVQQGDGEPVVVKRATTPDDVVRLRAERRLLESARHPGVVAVLETSDDRLTLAHGGHHTVLTHRPRSLDEVIALVAGLAEVLADLHARGVVHTRLTPDHVLVSEHGRPVLCGFSAAVLGVDHAAASVDVEAAARLGLALLDRQERADRGPAAWARRRVSRRHRHLRRLLTTAATRPETVDASRLAAGVASLATPLPMPVPPPVDAPPDDAVPWPLRPVSRPGAGGGQRVDDDGRHRPQRRRQVWWLAGPTIVLGALGALGVGAVLARGTPDPPAVVALPGAPTPTSAGAPAHGAPSVPPAASAGAPAPPAAGSDTPGVPSPIPGGHGGADEHQGCPEPSPPSPGPVADLDGDGCGDGLRLVGGVVVGAGRVLVVGEPGDAVVLGDWDCDGTDTVALLRPRTGSLFLFARWALDPAAPQVQQPLRRLPAGTTIERRVGGVDGCDQLWAVFSDGTAELQVPAP